MKLDLNCDVGESYGNFKVGNDAVIFSNINSCNIACGFHGGDPLTIVNTIKMALQHKVRIGAHPSYPDLQGFGRRKMKLSKDELFASILYQVCAVKGLVESLGGRLAYVKPHGALYNKMANDEAESRTVIEAIQSISPHLKLMGLAASLTQNIAKEKGIDYIAEAFADRAYTDEGKLVSRKREGAVILKAKDVVEQIFSIEKEQRIRTIEGKKLVIRADSICIHGDHPNIVEIFNELQKKLI